MNRDNRRLVTSEVMSRLDAATISEIGIPGDVLMENAGQKCWAHVRRRLTRSEGVRVVFIAGNGNNGGDSLVMARQCRVEGTYIPRVVTVRRDLKGAALAQWGYLRRLGLDRLVWEDDGDSVIQLLDELSENDVVVDGITGTGLTGPLREVETALVERINASSATVFSIDVPSGARDAGKSDEPVVCADVTLCTGYRKRCLYAPVRRSIAGEILQVDPGFPDLESFSEASWYPSSSVTLLTVSDIDRVRPMLSGVSVDAHKGVRGRLLILAGGDGTEGAALLSAEGAGTTGAGMIMVATTPSAAAAGIAREPGVMWRSGFPGEEDIAWANALVLGPGWVGGSFEELQRILTLLSTLKGQRKRPVVMDAAALRILKSRPDGSWRDLPDPGVPVIMTPHPGEMAVLADTTVDEVRANPFGILDEVFRPVSWSGGVTVVLKGSATIVRTGSGEFFVVDGRCPSLGVAGSGDVLTGILGARIAGAAAAGGNGTPPLASTVTSAVLDGVMEHLRRGRLLAEQFGSYTAGTLARTALPAVQSVQAVPKLPEFRDNAWGNR